jgi:Tol biopolymer transport system component
MEFQFAGRVAVISAGSVVRGCRTLRLSPDNKKAGYAGATAIWICDLQRNAKTRITFDNQLLREPAWSPDGKMLMFAVPAVKSGGGGEVEIRSKASDGRSGKDVAPPERLSLPCMDA